MFPFACSLVGTGKNGWLFFVLFFSVFSFVRAGVGCVAEFMESEAKAGCVASLTSSLMGQHSPGARPVGQTGALHGRQGVLRGERGLAIVTITCLAPSSSGS